MKVKLTTDEGQIIISDENLDNDNYVNIKVGDSEQDVLLSELMPAIIAFDAKRSRRISDEREY